MMRTLISVSVLAVGPVAALASSDPIAQRKELMTLNGKGFFGDITRMVRGQAPYDQAKVNAAFDQMVLSAKTFPSLFPDNAKPGAKTSAPPLGARSIDQVPGSLFVAKPYELAQICTLLTWVT